MTATDETKYNSDELVPPSFVNENLIREIVASAEEDPKIKLTSHEVKPGSSAGDHYASIMFKIIVTYETKGKTVSDRRFILKTMPENSCEKKDFLDDSPIFDNEIRMYSETLPAMEKLLSKFDEKRWWPKMVYFSKKPEIIVFDDLTQENFGMHYTPLNFDTVHVVLDKLAKYHALSMVLNETGQAYLVQKYMGFESKEKLRPIFGKVTHNAWNLAEAIKKWKGMEQIAEKILKMKDQFLENYLDCYFTPSQAGLNVLNHGDMHIRNMMFRKDSDGTPNEVMFLDFQIPMYQSLGFDVVYTMNCVCGPEIRERQGEFIKRYHSKLVESLKLYEFTGNLPSVIDIHIEVLRMSSMTAYQAMCFLPIFQVDLTGIELSELFNNDKESPLKGALDKLFADEKFIAEMTSILVPLDNLGIFD